MMDGHRPAQRVISLLLCTLLALGGCAGGRNAAPVRDLGGAKGGASASKKAGSGGHYVVKRGDTLYSVAYANGTDYRELARLNGIKAPYTIYVGQQIRLPGGNSVTQTATAGKTASDRKAPTKQAVAAVDRPKGQDYSGQTPKGSRSADSKSLPAKVSWVWPSRGPIIAGFSAAEHGNKGLDLGGRAGDPVHAAADGKVVYAGNALRGYGNLLIVKHNDDFLSAYAHNRRLLVQEQSWVKAGQQIAEMGDSGTTSVKLHFEIRLRGQSVNPLQYLPRR